MKRSKSKYPVGSMWQCKVNSKIGTIVFKSISEYGFEIWEWHVMYDDGSGHKFDWDVSYSAARRHIPFIGRFKKVEKT